MQLNHDRLKKKKYDPNALCDNLRILVASISMNNDGDMKSLQRIRAILDELHDLEIII